MGRDAPAPRGETRLLLSVGPRVPRTRGIGLRLTAPAPGVAAPGRGRLLRSPRPRLLPAQPLAARFLAAPSLAARLLAAPSLAARFLPAPPPVAPARRAGADPRETRPSRGSGARPPGRGTCRR